MTAQQKRLYDYVRGTIAETGIAPSYEEMKEALGLTSKAGIHRLLGALELHGHIERVRYSARAIKIVERTCPHCRLPL